MKTRTLAFLVTLLLAAMATLQSASAITVNSTADPTESGKTTLRDALASAADGDTINFSVTGTITLTSGELLVNDSITISGPGASTLAVNGNAANRVFHIASGKTVTISGLTITNGQTSGSFPNDSGGGIYNDAATLTLSNCTVSANSATFGGGIYNFGEGPGSASLTVSNCTVSANSGANGAGIYNDGESDGSATLAISNSTLSGNSATSAGGGIYNDGTFAGNAALTINNSTLNGNSALSFGGGIYNNGAPGPPSNPGSATLAISNSTLSGNSATSAGGGIYNSSRDISPAVLTLSNTTLSGNSAVSGGGIYNEASAGFVLGPARATLTISNSTLSGNSASGFGGGIYNFAFQDRSAARATITNSTLSGNSGANGAGIYNFAQFTGQAAVTIAETILKAGASGANIVNDSGIIISLGHNLSSDDASAFLNANGDQNGADPLLGPLQDNGGSTFTHALLTGSPAIDAGAPPLDFDQRGPNFARVVNGRIDIGAFEVQGTQTSIPPAAPIATNATGVTNNNFTANWNSVSNATGYRLDVAKNSSFKGGSFVAGYHNLNVGNVTSRFVGGLSANTTYYFRVRAFNSNGVSPSSNVITVTTSP